MAGESLRRVQPGEKRARAQNWNQYLDDRAHSFEHSVSTREDSSDTVAHFVGAITDLGPPDPPDFPTGEPLPLPLSAVYWVKAIKLVVVGTAESFEDFRNPEPGQPSADGIWVKAINIQEVGLGTHDLPVGLRVVCDMQTDNTGRFHFVFSPGGGGGGGHQEVVINGVFQTWGQCDLECRGAFGDDETAFFPHLGTNPVLPNGDVNQETYLKVHPNWGHALSEFAPVMWDVNAPNQPTFSVFQSARGWTMDFGQGEVWVTPPTNVCGEPGPDPDEIRACCLLEPGGTCSDTTLADCPAGVGEWKGAGTSCADPDICDTGAETGACCCTIPAACHNNKLPGDTTCWEGPTEADCIGQGGTWQGTGTVCGGSPGICGEPDINGACCFAFGECLIYADDLACGLAGGAWFGGPCEPGLCDAPTGSCCIGKACADDTTESSCTGATGDWFQDITCANNPQCPP